MSGRIYIVEDEALIAMELEDRLRELGYVVCGHAARGEVALREIPAARPDLILLDVNLGRGVSGLDVAEALRERLSTPIIFLTAYSDADLVARAAKTESFAYLVKPFLPQVLRANIEMALCRHAAERAVLEANERTQATAEALALRSRDLERALSLQRATLDATSEGILVVEGGDASGANHQLFAMWGLEGRDPTPTGAALLDLLRARLVDPDALLRAPADAAEHDLLELRDGRVFERRVRPRRVDGAIVGRLIALRDVTRERAAAAKLLERKVRLRRVLDHISDGLVVEDPEGRITFTNQRFAAMHATSTERLVGMRLADFVAPAWRPHLRPEGDAATVTYRALRGDGSTFWAEADAVPVRDPSGAVIGTQSTVRDVSERKLTEDALQILSTGVARHRGDDLLSELARQLARLLEVDVGFVGAFASGPRPARTIALWVDDAARRPGALGLAALPSDAADDAALTRAALACPSLLPELALADAALAHLVDSRGRRLGVLGVLSRAPLEGAPRVRAVLGLFAVLAGAKLEQQGEEQKFRDLFEFSPDPVLLTTRDGAIVMANRRAYALLGFDRDALLGKNVEELVPLDLRERHAEHRRTFHTDPKPRAVGTLDRPLRTLRADGSSLPVNVSLTPLNTNGEGLVVISLRDMSEHLRAVEQRASLQLQLRQAQKMEALGTLAGGIAHDFNNILGAIVANAELASHTLDADHPARPNVDALSAAAERATLLVRQILAFSRRQAPQRTPTLLAPIVEEAAKLLRATLPARIGLDVDIAADNPLVCVDVTQIHQVLMNLGTNASHAITAATGVIALRLDDAPDRGANASRHWARLVIRDDGCGMDTQTLGRAFEPFFTTKPAGRGSGLGLSVVHGIVAEHGGELTIDSAPGQGTTVTILLPACVGAELAAREPALPPAAPLAGDGMRILFIDDDPMLATVGEALLLELGYAVTASTDPQAALDTLRADPAGFDVVFTDFNMPALSGLDVTQQIAALAPQLPVILVSGHTGLSDDELRAAGIRYRLDKPYNLSALDRALRVVREENFDAEACTPA
ncbi:MAG: response regulator [Nannocystaceae bacterium]